MTSSWSQPAFAAIVQLVSGQTGLAFTAGRHADIEAAIRRAMARSGVSDVSSYAERVRAGLIPLDDLVTELTVGETYFFRHPDQFDFIRTRIVRDLLERRGPDHAIRVWSAGCATGEEPYSVAIALEEDGLRGRILATDISVSALARARRAVYRPWALRGLDEARIRRWFRRKGDHWVLHPRFVGAVTFQVHNLALDAYPSVTAGIWGMDLILCRNVLIYLDRPAIGRVARGLHASLAEGGWLVTGPSDPPLDALAPFVPVVTDIGVFYRKSGSERRTRVPVVDTRYELDIAGATGLSDQQPLEAETMSVQVPVSDPHEWTAAHPAVPADEPAGEPGLAAPSAGAEAEAPDIAAADPLDGARRAFAAGEWERAVRLSHADDEAAAILRVRALANARGSADAARVARRAVASHPLSTELHLLHAILLFDLKRHAEAEQAARRVVYLDRSLAVAHFLLGLALREQGKIDAARSAFRAARDLARTLPPDEALPFAEGERASSLARRADAELALLDVAEPLSRLSASRGAGGGEDSERRGGNVAEEQTW